MKKVAERALSVEKLGGAGSLGAGHVKSLGEVSWGTLSPTDQAAIDRLFSADPAAKDATVHGERYRITRQTARGRKVVTVAFAQVPEVLRNSVKDTIV